VAKKGFFCDWGVLSAIFPTGSEGALNENEQEVCSSRRAPLREHKFNVGQTVQFTSRLIGHMQANSTYEIVRLLPSDGADYQYRIKNPREAFERVARESQLDSSA
jgi:hypothetical protein